ncbi:MAG: HD domain-containing protein [Gammaproteobacteria bacterium]
MVTSTKPALAGTDFATWIASLPVSWTPQQMEIVGRAHRAARSALPSGIRNLEIADLLADLRMDHESISAALLHEAVNTGKLPLARVREEFGAAIADLVEGVDRLSLIGELHQHRIHKSEQLESLRKMLLAMAKDARVVLISLGSQLCKIRNIDLLPESQRQRLAHETVDVFAPLANRLGIGQFKWEMEDRALRCLDPHTYKTLAKALDERRSDRERYISEVMGLLKRELEKAGVRAEVTGRAKHLYSIWRKMQRKHVPFEQIFDVHAVRILVASVTDCYAALGTVHALWKNIPQEFDDYVAHPKDNGYQSLHTAVLGPQGKTVEVQIRTHDMHRNAELGIAAHWRYKEGAARNHTLDDQIAWLRQILEWKEDTADAGDFLDQFKAEALSRPGLCVHPCWAKSSSCRKARPYSTSPITSIPAWGTAPRRENQWSHRTLSYQLHNGEQPKS